MAVFDLERTYLLIDDGPGVHPVEGGATFWDGVDRRTDLDGRRLMLVSRQDGTATHWEMHPAGDEVLVLLSGAVAVVLETGDGERRVPLRPGETAIVPAGVWHTLEVAEPGRLLSITRAAGTQVR
jgi:mannose-6-phosphate isomerase-like protein (cupin superfamily)